MKKISHIGSMILNLVMFLGIAAIALNSFFTWWAPLSSSLPSGAMAFSDFTLDSALFFAVAAVITFIYDCLCLRIKAKEIPHYVRTLKLIAVSTLMASFLFSLIYIYPVSVRGLQAIFNPVDTLWIRFVLPILALISFLTFEHETKLGLLESLFAIIPSLVYFVTIFCLVYGNVIGDPYPIFNAKETNHYLPILYGLVITFGVFLLALIIIPIHNVFDDLWCRSITVATAEADQLSVAKKRIEEKENESIQKEESEEISPQKEETTEEDALVSYAPEDSEEEEEATERKELEEQIKKGSYNGRARVYHISKHKDGMRWQVRLATGKRAIKLFRTQNDAIVFAKELVKKNGGSIRIHSLKGKMRKEK